MLPVEWIQTAQARTAPHIRHTPLVYDPHLQAYFKWENRQLTGSFKIRGALNKVLGLLDWERARGLVTASAGNHGQGLAFAGQLVGAPVTVFVAAGAVPAKIKAMRDLGAVVQPVPGGYGEAEQAALAFAEQSGSTWVSPYNDGQVIAGQASLGLELLQELPQAQDMTWLVPVGGGGLLSGLGAALSSQISRNSRIRLVGVQSEASPFMHSLYHQQHQIGLHELPSLADGLSGPVQAGSLTIPLVRKFAHDLLLVSEAQIAEAIIYAWERHREKIEGSAAVGLAALLAGKLAAGENLVLITGGNIQPETHAQLIAAHHQQPTSGGSA